MPRTSRAVAPAKRTGRPSTFTPEIATAICAHVAAGGNLTRWCAANKRKYETVRQWMLMVPSFAEEYARARESRADARADRIDSIRDKVLSGKLDPNAARVAIDAEKWQAGKEQPKRYGDRLELDGKVKTEGQFTMAELMVVAMGKAVQQAGGVE